MKVTYDVDNEAWWSHNLRWYKGQGEGWPGDVGEGDRDDAHGLAAEEVIGHSVLALDASEVDADEGGEAEQGAEDGVLDQTELRVWGKHNDHGGDRGVDDIHLEQRRETMSWWGRESGDVLCMVYGEGLSFMVNNGETERKTE